MLLSLNAKSARRMIPAPEPSGRHANNGFANSYEVHEISYLMNRRNCKQIKLFILLFNDASIHRIPFDENLSVMLKFIYLDVSKFACPVFC